MKEIKILNSDIAKREFIALRTSVDNLVRTTSTKKIDRAFADEFSRIYTEATLGNLVCQDYLGYIFKRGKPKLVPENIDLSMKWLILSASNGNNFSIERLSIYLNHAYEQIYSLPDLSLICKYNKITERNFIYVVGRLFCDAVIDYLKIDALNIIKEVPDYLLFNHQTMHIYEDARQKVIPVVINFLRSSYTDKERQDYNIQIVENPVFDLEQENLEQNDLQPKKNKSKKTNIFNRLINKISNKETDKNTPEN